MVGNKLERAINNKNNELVNNENEIIYTRQCALPSKKDAKCAYLVIILVVRRVCRKWTKKKEEV